MNLIGFESLSINGKTLHGEALATVCQQKLNDEKLPVWEKKLFYFILDLMAPTSTIRIKTSGTTGFPKDIPINKDQLIQSARMTGKYFNLKKNDSVLLCLPVDFIAGKMMVVRSFILGLNLIPFEPRSNPLENISRDFEFGALTPMQAIHILTEKSGEEKLNRIAKLIIGSAEISVDQLDKIKSLKNQTWQTYGMTETLTHVAVRKLNPPGESEYYKALQGVSFTLDDRGCLIIFAPHISLEKVITNDVVELKNRHEFKFIGRYDNIINSGGMKFSPESIEARLSPFIHQRFIIGGLPDDKLGQKVVLILENQPYFKVSLKELAEKAGLSKYEIPKEVIYPVSFVISEGGKLIRNSIIKNCLSGKD